jgi:hypothetical protein
MNDPSDGHLSRSSSFFVNNKFTQRRRTIFQSPLSKSVLVFVSYQFQDLSNSCINNKGDQRALQTLSRKRVSEARTWKNASDSRKDSPDMRLSLLLVLSIEPNQSAF